MMVITSRATRTNNIEYTLLYPSFVQRIAGEIKSFSTDGWVAPKLSKRMDKFMLYMLTAGKKALEYGGITEEVMNELDKTKCGILIGSAMGGMKVAFFKQEFCLNNYGFKKNKLLGLHSFI